MVGGTRFRVSGRTRWHLAANGLVLCWLAAATLVGLGYDVAPDARWLVVHLFALGGVTTAIVVWSTHFTVTLLHRPPPSRGAEAARLALLTVGALTVCLGVVEESWPALVIGALSLVVALGWHLAFLLRSLRRTGASRFAVTVRYYVAAFGLLVLGAGLGVVVERGDLTEDVAERLASAHLMLNLLGFVALTVVGTLVMMWPMLLRTRIADTAEADTERALPVLVLGLLTAAAATALGSGLLAAAGVFGYGVGLALPSRSWVEPARRKPPRSFPPRSVVLGGVWLAGTLLVLAGQLAVSGDTGLDELSWVTPVLLVGFVAQVLAGGLTFLVPVVVGGGPARVRRSIAVAERLPVARLAAVNLGLLAVVLPLPAAAARAGWVLVLLGLGVTVPLLAWAALQGGEEQPDLASG